jgi:hypothetical protein
MYRPRHAFSLHHGHHVASLPTPAPFPSNSSDINKDGASYSLAPSLRLNHYSAAIASAIAPSTPERIPNPGSTINHLAAVHFVDAA